MTYKKKNLLIIYLIRNNMKNTISIILVLLLILSVSNTFSQKPVTRLPTDSVFKNKTGKTMWVLTGLALDTFTVNYIQNKSCKKRDSLQVIQIATQTEINRICDSALIISRKESKIWYDSLIFYDNKLKTTEIDLVKEKKCKRTLFITSAISTLAAITFAILFIIK